MGLDDGQQVTRALSPLDHRILAEVAEAEPGDWTVDDIAALLARSPDRVSSACARLRKLGYLEPSALRVRPPVLDRLRDDDDWITVCAVIGVLPVGHFPRERHAEMVMTLRRLGPTGVRDLASEMGQAAADGSATTAFKRTLRDLDLTIAPVGALWITDKGRAATR